jgi:23S rRNA pseudouridine2605 synthase
VERLQKILSQAGIASRRAAEQMMLDGRVSVNGATVRELGTKADPARDDIRVDGSRVKIAAQHRYILLNKPRGYVTTRSDPERRKTVLDLLRGVKEYVYPVGRLDYESEGLLLLMNDGDLAARLTHPSHGIARVYEARVLGIPDAHDLERLQKGMTIDGRRMRAADVTMLPLKRDATEATLVITLREGKNRQVRNMCDAIGHPVDHLKRVAIGPLKDSRLKLGFWRDLTAEEVERLRKSADQKPAAARTQHARRKGPDQ